MNLSKYHTMATKRTILQKLSRTVILLAVSVLFSMNTFAQPNWVATTPSTDPFSLYVDLSYGTDQASTVYGFLLAENYTTILGAGTVESFAGQPTNASRISRFTIPIAGGDINNVLTTRFYNQNSGGYLLPNKEYTFVIVAKNGSNQYSSVEYIHFTTPACPSIFVETGLNNFDRCVNGDGATKTYTFTTRDGDNFPGQDAGILEGARWTLDWGDGSGPTLFHTSTYENDGPGLPLLPGFESGFLQHTYNTHEDCFYVASLTIENVGACAATGSQSESKIPILHGRDFDIDGNGEFIVDEVGTGITDTIYVCEGYEYTTSIEDISTWDCQPDIYYPSDPPGSPSGEANEDPRYLQWVYGGASPNAAFEANANTITGNVVVGGLGSVTNGDPGLMGDTIKTDSPILNISNPITIPATAQEGEMFKIYYKNWNICNPFSGTHYDNSNYIETEIVILIIHAPDPPLAPDVDDCFGSVGPLTASASEGGVLTWYSDAALTTIVHTGGTFNHGQTAVGSYTYWVTEMVPPCEGPPQEVNLTIHPLPDNTLSVSDDEACEGSSVDVILSNSINGTRYWLRNDANDAIIDGPINGNGGNLTFTFTPAASVTCNVLAEITATGCQNEMIDKASVTINPLANITQQPTNQSACDEESITISTEGTGPSIAYRWFFRNGGAWAAVPTNANFTGASAKDLIISNVTGLDGYEFRCRVGTTGPCYIYTNTMTLTVNPLPLDRTVVADDPYMCYNGSTDIVVQNSENAIEYTLRIGTTNQSMQTGNNANLSFATGALTSTTTYNVVARNPVTSCTRNLSDAPVVTINPNLTANVPNIADQCVDTDVNLPAIQRSGGSGSYSYAWTGTGGFTSTSRNPGAFTTAITGTHSYTGTVTDAGFLTASTGGGDPTTCTAFDTETFDVFALPIDRNVTIDHTQICYNTGTVVNIESSENGVSYELWNNALSTSYGTQVGDGTTLHFATGNLTAGVTFRVLATGPTTPACQFELTDNPSVTVNANLGVVAGVDDNSICEGTTINLTSTPGGGSGSYSFAWSGPDAFSSIAEDPSHTPASEGLPHTYTVVVSDIGFTPTAPLAACTATDNIDVTVNLNPSVNVTPAAGGFCTNAVISMDGNLTTGTGSTITHLWSGDTSPLSALNIETPDFQTAIPAVYNLTYRATDENGCYDEDNTILSISGPTADIEADGISAETAGICDNTDLDLDGNPTGNPTAINNATHLWTEGPVAITGMLAPMGPGAAAQTPVFNSSTVGSYTYYYEVQDGSGCFAYDTIVVTVSQVDAVPTPLAPSPCAGQTVNINGNPTGGSGLYSVHTWTEDVGNPEAGTLTNANTQTPSFTATTPGTYTFDYYVEDNAGCNFTVNNYTIVVKPVPNLTNGLANTICSGNAAGQALSISNGPLVVTYAWPAPTYSNGTLDGGNAGSGATISDILENKFTNTDETATYSVTPTSDGCSGPAEDVVITIHPEPVVTPDQTATTCSDIAVAYEINVDNINNALVEYTWAAPINSGGMTGGSLRNPRAAGDLGDTFNNVSNSTQTATYTVTPYFNGCPGDAEAVVINVKPEPVITALQNPTTCSSTALDYRVLMNNFTNPGDAVTFTWLAPTLDADPDFSGGAARAIGTASNISDSYINTSNLTLQSTYNIVPRYDGCNGNTETVIIDVKPEPVITPDQEETVCSRVQSDLDIQLENFTNPGDVVSFTWGAPLLSTTTNFSGGGARAVASVNPIRDTYINQTGTQQTATYTVTPYYNGCSGTAVTVVIKVDPEPVVTPGQEPPICSDVQLNYEIAVSNVDPTLVSYTWALPSLTGGISGGTVRNPAATGNIDDTFNNVSSLTRDASYSVTPYYGGCAGPVQSITVKVAPEPVITAGQNPETCSQTALNHFIALDNFASGDGVMYRWAAPTLDADPDFSGGAARIGATAGNLLDSYTNKSNTTLSSTYSIIPSLNGCDGNAESLVVDVKPEPEITAGQIVTVCSGEVLDIEVLMENFTNPGDNVTFTWPVPVLDADPDFSGGSSRPIANSNNISDTYTNLSGVQLTATYSITPRYNGCDGEVETLVVRVNPEPQMTSTNAETICDSETPSIVFASDIPATYDWEVTFVGGSILGTSLGETGSGNIPHALFNSGAVASNVIYRVTPTSGASCEGAPQNVTITVNAPATATATNSMLFIVAGDPTAAGAAGLQVTLGGAAVQGAPAGWVVVEPFPTEGSFDDEYSLSPIFTPSANQETAGYTILQYITNDPDGGIGPCLPDTAEVYINIGELPTANAGNDTIMCFENSIELRGWIGGSATSGTWSVIAGGGSGTMSASTTTATTVTATYTFGADEIGVDVLTFRLETDDPDGAGPVPATYDDKIVTVNPLPISSSVTGRDTVCINTASLVYSVTLTPGSTYDWIIPSAIGTLNFGGSGLNSNMSIITSSAVGGRDSIRVFETNQFGCVTDTVYKPVTVLEQSTPDPISGPTSLCAFSQDVTYSVPDFPGSTYQWFYPIGAAPVTDPTQNTIDLNFAQFSGQIRVIETNPGGCITNHGPLNVTVNALPVATINALPMAVCQGSNVTFTAGPAGQANYEFFVNGASVQDGASNTFSSTTINNLDQVTVIVRNAAGCEDESNPVQITVYDLPTVILTSDDNTICDGTPVNFSAASASAVNYNFFLNGTSQQSGGQNFYVNSTLLDGDEVYVNVLSAFGCAGISNTITTTVFDLPEASIDGDYTICPGTSENLVVSVTNGLSPFDITIDNGVGLIPAYISGNNIPVTPAFSTTYRLSEITDANGCTSTTGPNITGTAVITHLDTVQILTQPKVAEVCETVDTSFSVGSIGSGRTFEWFVSNTFTGPYAAVPASNVSTLDIVAPTSAEDGNYYYVVVTGTCDSEISDTVQLIIKYDPISARDPFDASICEGFPTGFGVDAGATEGATYQWYVREDGASPWQSLLDTAFYSGSKTDSLMIASGRSYMNGFQYYVEITGDCSGAASSAPATLLVSESPEILAPPSDDVVCEGDVTSFTVDAGVTTGATYVWQVDMRAGGGWETIGEDSAGVYSGYNTSTLSVTTASRFNQYRYRVIVSGTCNPAQTSSYATLTVNEIPEVLSPPASSTICEDQSTIFSVDAGVTSGVMYEWEVYDGSSWETIGGDTAIYNGHANSTLILSSVPSRYDGYEYRVTVSGTCAAPITPAAVTLNINEQPEILTQPVNDTVCDGDATSFTIDHGVTTVPTYQWQVNKIGLWTNLTAADESPTTYTGVTAQTLQVNQPDLSYNAYRYRVILSGTCTPPVTSDFATLIIDTRPEISLQPDSITTCEDGDVQFMVIAGGTSEPEYQWEYSDDNGANWADAADLPEVFNDNLSTLNVVTVPSSYEGMLFRVWVSGKCTAPVESDHALLTVWQKPEVTTDPVDETACEQDTVMFTVDAGLTTSPVYTWQYWNGSAWLACSGAIYEGIHNDTLYINGIYSSLNGRQYRALISGACLPEMPSAAATLTVDERPEIILQPLDEEICEGDNISFSITTGVTTAPLIRWEYFDGIWNLATGGIFTNEDQPTIDLNNVPSTWDGREFRAIVGNLCGPEDTSSVVTLTVNQLPEIIGQPVESTTCEGIATLFGVDAGVTTNASFQWEVDKGSGWVSVTGGEYSGANDDTLRIANPASYMNGYEFRVVVSGECTPPITSNEVFLYIEENPEITIQPIGDAICEGDNTSFTVNAGATTSPTYEWFVDTGSGMVSLGVDAQHSGITNPTLDITGALFSMDENEYQVVVSGSCGVPVNSDVIELIVYKAPEITMQPEDTTTCELKNVSFSVETGDTDSPDLQWYENNGTTGWQPIANGGKYSGTETHTLQIFVVDSAMNGYEYRVDISNICDGPLESDEVTLYVQNPAVIWDQPDDLTICEASTADFEVVATGTNITYQWQVDMRDGNNYQNLLDTAVYTGSATDHLQVAVPATALANTSRFSGYRYRVIVTSADCTPAKTSDYAELTIQELAEVVTAPIDRTLCEDESTTLTVNSGVTTNPTYLWEVDNGDGWKTIGADTAIYSGYNNATLILSTIPSTYNGYLYRVTVGGPCASSETPAAILLTVNERPEIDAGPVSDTVCENDPTSFTVDPGVTTAPIYQWQVNKFGAWANLTGADEGPTTYTGVTAQTLLVNQPDLSYNNYQYRVIVNGTCGPAATSEAAVLVIDTRPEVLIDPIDRVICEDDDVEFTVHAGGTTEPEYLWYYSTDNGSNWTDAVMLGEVLTSTDDTLSLSSVPASLDGAWFRALISGKCPPAGLPVYSATAVLTVYEKPEILNYTMDTVGCEQDSLYMFINPGVTTMPTYNWQYHNGATWLTVPPSPYQGYNKDTLFINGLSSSLNGMRYRVILGGYCAPDSISEEIVLTVNERPEVLGIPIDQTICEFDGTSFGISTGVTTNPIVEWEYFNGGWNTAGAGDGIFSNWNTDTLVLANVDASWDGVQFRAIVSNTECGPNDTSMVATLTVKNRPLIIDEPDNATTCENVPTLFGIDGGITSNPTYNWEVSNDEGVNWTSVFGSAYAGVGTDTLDVLNPTSAMHGYQYRVVLGGYCTPNDTSDVATLTILENPEIVLEPVNAAICELQDTLFFIDAGLTTAPTYQWYYDDGTGMKVLPEAVPYSGTNDSALIVSAAPFTHDTYLFQVEVSGFCGTPALSKIVELVVYKEPEIVVQPVSVDTCEFSNISFSIDVGVTESPLIQWFEDNGTTATALSNGGGYIGANSETLQIFGVDSSMTGYEYYATVLNDCAGPLASDPAVLTVRTAPKIWVEPSDATICEFGDTSFTVEATGYNMVYTWYVDDGVTSDSIEDAGVYSGQGTPTLTISGADRNYHRYRYYVQISGTCIPMVQSDIVFLNINNPAEISTQPINDTICEFATAKFSATATGYALTYQWEESSDNWASSNPVTDGGNYIGATSRSLSIFGLDRSYDGYQYRLQIMSDCGNTTTDAVELTVQTPPEIVTDPVDNTVCHGTAAEFEIDIVGSELTYEWYVNEKTGSFDLIELSDTDYSGANSAVLTKVSADYSTENGYSYYVKVIGSCGNYTSEIVYLNVNELAFIDGHPIDKSVCEGGSAWFQVNSHVANLLYEWEVSSDNGATWTTLVDDGNYVDLNTDRMTINTTDRASMNANQYRVAVISVCDTIWSDPATLTVWDNPTPNIIGDLATFPLLCGGDILTMDGNPTNGSGNYTTHLWSGDVLHLDGVNDQTAEFETKVKGSYNINYTVTDDNNCIGQTSVTIENHRPTAQFTSDAVPKCGDLLVHFENRSSAEATNFLWNFDNGFTSTEVDPDQAFDNFDETGLVHYYNILLEAIEVVNPQLTCKDSAYSVVTIYPKVNPEISATPLTGCQPLEVYMQTKPGAAGYIWDYGDGTGENGSYTTYHTFINLSSSTLTYETVLQTTSAYGCVATDTVEIVVDPIPQPNFTANPAVIPEFPEAGNAIITFKNSTVVGPWTFVYKFGDGSPLFTTTNYNNVIHEYTEPGIYTVTLYTNIGDCIDSASTVVTINPRSPEALFSSITVGCHPLEVEFTNLSKYASSYTWQFGDGSISLEENPTHIFYQPGNYTVKLIATGAGGTAQSSKEIVVNATPQVFFNYAPDSVFVNDKPVRFFNLTSYADNYLWDFGDISEFDGEIDKNNNSTQGDPLHTYMFEGWKDVKLRAWNEFCEDSLLIPLAIKVIPAGELVFPNIFRPLSDPPSYSNVNDLSDEERNTVFFPGVNKQVQEYHLYIYNRWGELIFQSDDINTGWNGHVRGTLAAQGVYIWKVTGIYSNGSPFSDAGDVTLVWVKD